MTKRKKGNDRMKYILFILIIIGILMFLWARFVSTSGLLVKEYKIDNMPNLEDLKIVQFSDLHFMSTIREKELIRVVDKINAQKPDIVLFTGDLFDNNIILQDKDKEILIRELRRINANIEILAVKGNHDYEANYFDDVMNELGWKLLNNTYEFVYYNSNDAIAFVGFDDYTDGKPDYENAFSFVNEDVNVSNTFVILHEPDQIDKVMDKNWDIAFAGHSHLGQVRVPLIGSIWTPYGSKKYVDDYYKFDNKKLFVSNGIGTSSLNVRFFNKPSISLFRFISK